MNNTPLADTNPLATDQLTLAQSTDGREYSAYFAALTTMEQAYFSTLKSYSIASINADGDYSLALFNAERDRAEAYITEAITEIIANYAKEAELAAKRAAAYSTQFGAIMSSFNSTQFAEGRGGHGAVVDTMTQGEQTAYFGEIVSVCRFLVATNEQKSTSSSRP